MNIRSILILSLCAVPCFGSYNPKDFSFVYGTMNGKTYFPKFPDVVATMTVVMKNVPLYFESKDNKRDYVRDVSFFLQKNINGTYNLRYKILSSRKCEDMMLKEIQTDAVEAALKDTFPNMLSPEKHGVSVTVPIVELYQLRESENKDLFLSSLKFINNFLPIDKLNFDEQDLLVEVVKEPESKTGLRSWFSLDAWRNWFRGNHQQ